MHHQCSKASGRFEGHNTANESKTLPNCVQLVSELPAVPIHKGLITKTLLIKITGQCSMNN